MELSATINRPILALLGMSIALSGLLHRQIEHANTLNLRGRLLLSEALSAQAHHKMSRLAEEKNRVVLPAFITGSVNALTVRIDKSDIAKRALKYLVGGLIP